jgi:adenylate cyclase
MKIEIERKFLLKDRFPYWSYENSIYYSKENIRQGYFQNSNIRVRIIDEEKAFLTIKGDREYISRDEFEYEIPIHDAYVIISLFCPNSILKTRYMCKENGLIWEIDIFHELNEGLEIAEAELESEDQKIILPSWIGKEVTDDDRYYNHYLCENPYRIWCLGDRYG